MNMREAFEQDVSIHDRERCRNGKYKCVSTQDDFEEFARGWKTAISHIGDGSKAEPVGHFYNDPKNGRVGIEWCCDHLDSGTALFVRPAPTAQDSRKRFDPGTLGFLLEYIGQGDPEVIDSDEYEFLGETEDGLTGTYTHSITNLCLQAAEALKAQDSKVPEDGNYTRIFNAIAHATKIEAGAIAISVKNFKEAMLAAPSIAETPDHTEQPLAMVVEKPQLSAEDLQIIRQWYNCVSDLNPKYLNADGFDDAAVIRKVSALIGDRPQPPEKQ